MIEQTRNMNDAEVLAFEAETMRQFEDSDAFQIVKGKIQTRMDELLYALLDARVTRDDKLLVIAAQLRAMKDTLMLIHDPISQKENDMFQRQIVESMRDNYLDDKVNNLYRGGGATL